VGDEPAPFDSKEKALRCPFIPAFKDLFFREAIKGDIQLYCIKTFGVEFKPLFLGKVRRIEDPIPPMGIVITAGSDVNHNLKGFEDSRVRGFKYFPPGIFTRPLESLTPIRMDL